MTVHWETDGTLVCACMCRIIHHVPIFKVTLKTTTTTKTNDAEDDDDYKDDADAEDDDYKERRR